MKTVRFSRPKYLGDPINIVRIFNEREVDELVVLDIDATPERRPPRFEYLAQLASECFMPLCYGGGVRTIEDIRRLFGIGLEKVAINTQAVVDPGLVEGAAREFGSQSIVVSIDVMRDFFGRRRVVTHGGRRKRPLDPAAHAREMEGRGAGELFLNAVDRDGKMKGYDLELVRDLATLVRIPVVACGGAGSLSDVRAVLAVGAAGAAAGSLFSFAGRSRAVLINYPDRADVDALVAQSVSS